MGALQSISNWINLAWPWLAAQSIGVHCLSFLHVQQRMVNIYTVLLYTGHNINNVHTIAMQWVTMTYPCKHIASYMHNKNITYHIAGIPCEVLICANYASCRGFIDFNSVRLLSTLSFSSVIDLHMPQFHACDYTNTKRDTKYPCRRGILWSLSLLYKIQPQTSRFLRDHMIWRRIASQI